MSKSKLSKASAARAALQSKARTLEALGAKLKALQENQDAAIEAAVAERTASLTALLNHRRDEFRRVRAELTEFSTRCGAAEYKLRLARYDLELERKGLAWATGRLTEVTKRKNLYRAICIVLGVQALGSALSIYLTMAVL